MILKQLKKMFFLEGIMNGYMLIIRNYCRFRHRLHHLLSLHQIIPLNHHHHPGFHPHLHVLQVVNLWYPLVFILCGNYLWWLLAFPQVGEDHHQVLISAWSCSFPILWTSLSFSSATSELCLISPVQFCYISQVLVTNSRCFCISRRKSDT